VAVQDSCLLHDARKIRDHLFVDGRGLRLSRLPDSRQVIAVQDCQEARCHTPSKRGIV
jgi:hypothetical protein